MEIRRTTQEVILDATDRLMGRYGFRKMTMEDIAKEAGVSKRTIYVHFAGKEDVGLSSIGRVVQQVQDELAELASSEKTVSERLRAVLIHRVLGRLTRVQDYSQSLDELFEAVRPKYLERRKAFFDKEVELINGLLEAGRSEGVFFFEDGPACAKSLLLATNAFIPYSLSVREIGELSRVEQDLRTMVALLMAGLGCPK